MGEGPRGGKSPRGRVLSRTPGGLRPEGEQPDGAPGKPPKGACGAPVPQTDTGGRGEEPKVLETTREKELGKLTP